MSEVPVPAQAGTADGAVGAAKDGGVIEHMPRVTSAWLGLREAADAVARAADLVALIRPYLAGNVVIHDLGCGTGAMGRWLAPRLPGRQHWIMCDRDPDLLERAVADMTSTDCDGAPVTVETRQGDITHLTADDLGRRPPSPSGGQVAGLVTASALLDLLTMDEVERIAAACVGAGTPALLTLSVVGRVDFTPADPLDAEIGAAFDAHQRRTVGGRRLLGPDSVDAALDAFTRLGAATVVRPSPWRLGAGNVDLLSEWLRGWLDAACEQRPELAAPASAYAARRQAEMVGGDLGVVVHHCDLFAHRE